MNKKGFTLVELLAIIVILAIIITISVPGVRTLINSTRMRTHINNENKLVEAAQLYLDLNSNLIPKNVGDTTEVKLSDLQAAKHVGIIESPMDKDKNCNGYVLITKIDDEEYDYTPHLNCVEDIGNSIEDGLMGHWRFDDFQEPTENLIANGDMNDGMNNWLNNQNITKKLTNRNRKTYLKVTSAQSSSTPGIRYADIQVLPNTTYTYSFNVKSLKNNLLIWVTNGSNVEIDKKTNLQANRDNDIRVFLTFNSGDNTTIRLWLLFSGVTTGDWFEITDAQLEEKPYNTPFANGIRSGIVHDYSLNGNNAQLQLATTPRWVSEGKVGGAYEFSGTSNLISTKSFTVGPNLTVCFWTKPYNIALKEMVLHGSGGGGAFEFFQYNKNLALRGGGSSPLVSSSKEMGVNEWTFACGTINGNAGKVYYNGVLSNSGTVVTPVISSKSLNIGAYGDLRYGFNGVIDDVRIYNRVLSADEIKYNYDIQMFSNK
ncbi:MAG: LamG domain-containing protein [Bacilli bacterium]|nr:LamG domain-containing protein [Bacilli bacterium]MDD4298265.1 LamG domain-containing protein [Bacilli bacterium]